MKIFLIVVGDDEFLFQKKMLFDKQKNFFVTILEKFLTSDEDDKKEENFGKTNDFSRLA